MLEVVLLASLIFGVGRWQMAATIYLVSADGSDMACQAVAVLLTAPAQHRHSTGLATGLAACVAYYGIESGNVCKYRAAGGATQCKFYTQCFCKFAQISLNSVFPHEVISP